jgi:hypothetical protein
MHAATSLHQLRAEKTTVAASKTDGMSSSTSGSEVQVQEKMKPCNVWSCNRLMKKSCVVSNLTSLKVKGILYDVYCSFLYQ